MAGERGDSFPAESVAVVLKVYWPSFKEAFIEKIPFASAVVEPNREVPLKSLTILFFSAEPVIVGEELLVFVNWSLNKIGWIGGVISEISINSSSTFIKTLSSIFTSSSSVDLTKTW